MELGLVEFIAIGILLLHIALVSLSYNDLPALIPIHFGLDGEPDSWGSPKLIWTIVLLAIIMITLIFIVSNEKYINVPSNMELSTASKILKHINISTQFILFLLSYLMIEVAMSRRSGLGKTFLFLIITLIVYPFYFLI